MKKKILLIFALLLPQITVTGFDWLKPVQCTGAIFVLAICATGGDLVAKQLRKRSVLKNDAIGLAAGLSLATGTALFFENMNNNQLLAKHALLFTGLAGGVGFGVNCASSLFESWMERNKAKKDEE